MTTYSVSAISSKWSEQVSVEAPNAIEALHLAIEKFDPPESYALAISDAFDAVDAQTFAATGRISCEAGSLSISADLRNNVCTQAQRPLFMSEMEIEMLALQLRSFVVRPASGKIYLVAGVYLGSRDRYATTVIASTVEEAALVAHRQCRIDNLDGDAEMEICGIFEGAHHVLLDMPADAQIEQRSSHDEDLPTRSYKVIARHGDYEVEARSALEAEQDFGVGEVACVVELGTENVLTLGAKELVTTCGYEAA